jgi:hypothetical protein
MRKSRVRVFALLLIIPAISPAQDVSRRIVCQPAALAALKPLPKLHYSCGDQSDDSDEKILRVPERIRAKQVLVGQLEALTSAPWWQANPDDLAACSIRLKPGVLTKTMKEKLAEGEHRFQLFGNSHIRLFMSPDPCYQTQYNGAVGYLLYRKGAKVVVSEALDGYFSRADNSVDIEFARMGNEEIVEIITTSGGLNPEETFYFFAFDARTSKAVPKNLFTGDHGPTNQITSAMLFSDPTAWGLPANARELQIIKGNKLANQFSVYFDDNDGKYDDNGRKLSRAVLHWNGHIYK